MLPLVYHPSYSPSFNPAHRFPMSKFGLLANYMREEGLLTDTNCFFPDEDGLALPLVAHDPSYVEAFRQNRLAQKAQRRIGLPWSTGLCQRSFLAVAGTLKTAQLALQYGMAGHLAGGTHHAHYDFGSGFCIFNDLAVTARALIMRGEAQRVLILDLDVHQGDGSARILQQDADIVTCSVHCKENFPYRKADSDYDIEISRGATGEAYMRALEAHLPYIIATTAPDLILYDAGVDVHRDDLLGYLTLTDEDIAERDTYVLSLALAQQIPTAVVIGGGYSKDRMMLAKRHGIVYRVAASLFEAMES